TRQQVDVNRVAGIPTTYTVHLSGGRTVQVYLDPDKPGRNDFHVTFFDAGGTELPAAGITVTVAAPGGMPRNLDVRTLEPGHVAATLMVAALPQTFVIGGTAPTGGRPSSRAVSERRQPAAGATVTGKTLHIVISLEGAQIVAATTTDVRPDQGHVHLYVDNSLVSMNYGLEQDIAVHPGTYVIKA